jgi:hypothetical protein
MDFAKIAPANHLNLKIQLKLSPAWRLLPDEFASPPTCWRRLKLRQNECLLGQFSRLRVHYEHLLFAD